LLCVRTVRFCCLLSCAINVSTIDRDNARESAAVYRPFTPARNVWRSPGRTVDLMALSRGGSSIGY
jgi:hypothetical protein